MSNLYTLGSAVLDASMTTVSWRKPNENCKWQPMMVITEPSNTEDGVHRPAQSIYISNTEAIKSLRDACDQALGSVSSRDCLTLLLQQAIGEIETLIDGHHSASKSSDAREFIKLIKDALGNQS